MRKGLRIAGIILIILNISIPAVYAFVYELQSLNFTQTIVRMWFNNNWNYRKSHIINGIGTNAGTNYQIRIVVANGTGTDNGETMYINNKARSDFGDIRFTTVNGILLDYWMESLNVGKNATFWIEIAGNLTGQAQTIYLYYGNPIATTTSNGNNTFIFFDDFSGNLSKWTKHINGANIYIESGYLVCGGGVTSSPYGHTVLGSNASYSGFLNGIIEADIYPSTQALPEIGFRGTFSLNTGYKGRWDCRSGSESPWMKPPYNNWQAFGSSVTRFGIPNQWQKVKLVIYGSTFRIYNNGVLKSTVTDSQYTSSGELSLQNHYGSYSRFDNVRVRKYVEPEPLHGIWGNEQTR
jgi:hypothetical protein